MEEKVLKQIYQVKKETYNQLITEEGVENNLYFVREFDMNGTPFSSSIYLGNRLYGQTFNNEIIGNDIETSDGDYIIPENNYSYTPDNTTQATSGINYEEYNNVINNGGEIELEQDIVNTQTIIE